MLLFQKFGGHPANVTQTTIGGDAGYTQLRSASTVLLEIKYDGDTHLNGGNGPPAVVLG
ncbi:hypothetical protein ART_3834 [Arthrobacter sp. PAMC 25486]|nr:hypothetical protein ART_3834 [Arthrobacter sp. PAMC 25486]